MKKKVISLLLAVCIVSSSFNTVFAEEVPETYSDYDASPAKNPVISHDAEDTEQNNASADNESLVNQDAPISSDDALVSNDSDSEDIISESESPLNTEETEENIASDKTETTSDILTDPASLSAPETIKGKSESAPVTKTAIKLDTPVLTKLIKYDTIELSWTKINNAEKYYIYRKIPGGNWSQIAETTDNTYQETEHLASGQKYIYTVRAYADGVRSGYDATGLSIWNLDVPLLTEIEIVSTGISVSWDTVNAADKYCVYRKAEGAASWTSLGTTTNTTYIDKERLDSAVTYIYTVRACKESSRSYFNPEGISITSLSAPELTQIVKYNTIELFWNEVPGAEKYYIYRKVPGGHWSQIATTEAPMFKEPESLTYGQEYIYTVRAVLNGKRSYYDTDGLKILNLKTPELSKTENTSNGISIKWNTVSGIDGYYVYRKVDGASSWTLIGKTNQTSYIDKDALQSGIKYLYTVRAYKGSDKSYFETDGISVIKLTTPVLTKIIKYDAIELTWEEVAGAEEYYIYRKIPGGHWSQIATTKNTSYTEDKNLATGQEYVYTVRAYAAGQRSYYETAGLSIWNLDVPILKSAENAAGGVKVGWQSVTKATGYYVYRKASGASSWTLLGKTSSTSYTDKTALQSGTKYLYTVRASRESSNSYFDPKGISVLYLSTPTLVGADNVSTGIKISWKSVKGAEGYKLYRRIIGGPWQQIAQLTSTNYIDKSSLISGTKYLYTVRAYNGTTRSYYVESGVSEIKLTTPSLINAQNNSGGIKVTWKSVKGATSYRIYRKIYGGTSWKWIGTSKTASYTDKSSLTSGNKYVYTVRALKSSDLSYYDPDGITETKLNTPALTSAKKVSGGVKITWQSVKGASGYYVYRRLSGKSWIRIATTTSTSYTDKTTNINYIYTVKAYKSSDMSWYNTSGIKVITNKMLRKAQSFSSSTKWLILVDTTANKVGIYYGSKGNWTEKKYWSCTTGAASTPTVKGSFTVKSKGLAFGSGYTCWYYTQFYGNYLFHSVLYNPGSKTSIQDGRLGINASHGCVRLSLTNAKWIYDNIPSGTKVYIY